MAKQYITELWLDGAEVAGDCIPDYFATMEEAKFQGILAIAENTCDWPVAFSVREVDHDDETIGTLSDVIVVGRTVPTEAQKTNVLRTMNGRAR